MWRISSTSSGPKKKHAVLPGNGAAAQLGDAVPSSRAFHAARGGRRHTPWNPQGVVDGVGQGQGGAAGGTSTFLVVMLFQNLVSR